MQIKTRGQIKKEKFLQLQCMKAKISTGTKTPVVCTTTGEFFSSIREASKYYNLHYTSVQRVLSGKYYSVKGYKFEYSLGTGKKVWKIK